MKIFKMSTFCFTEKPEPKKVEVKRGANQYSTLEENKTFQCDMCEKKFMSTNSLRVHKKFNCHDKIKAFFCELCGKNYSRKQKLDQHINAVHEKKRNYKCEVCGKGFTWENACREHVKLMHGDMPKLQCEHCGFTSKTKSQLTAHYKRIHENSTDQFKCNQMHNGVRCKLSFPVKSNLGA